MPSWELLPHTADTGFRARADSLEHVLEQACLALTAIVLDASALQAASTREISAPGESPEDACVNLLNEVLWLLDGERWAPARVHVSVRPGEVGATLEGEPRDDLRHPPRIVVKAATYHQLRVAETSVGWEVEVYLDV